MDRPRFSTLRVCSWRPACRECEGRARTCGASTAVCSLSFQTQLSPSSPFRHFRPPLSLTPPALRVLWIWRHLRQRRDRSAAAAGGVVWGCVAAWRVCQTSKESAKRSSRGFSPTAFFKACLREQFTNLHPQGRGSAAARGAELTVDTRAQLAGEAAPSSPAERKSSARSGAAARVQRGRFAGLLGCH